jgi:hypothetical protein
MGMDFISPFLWNGKKKEETSSYRLFFFFKCNSGYMSDNDNKSETLHSWAHVGLVEWYQFGLHTKNQLKSLFGGGWMIGGQVVRKWF